jgi:hypothetical protein
MSIMRSSSGLSRGGEEWSNPSLEAFADEIVIIVRGHIGALETVPFPVESWFQKH